MEKQNSNEITSRMTTIYKDIYITISQKMSSFYSTPSQGHNLQVGQSM